MKPKRQKKPAPPPALIATVGSALPATTPLEESFADFFQRVHDVGMDHAQRFVGYDAAEDAVAGAIDQAWEEWSKVQPEERTTNWFLRAVRFRVLAQLRHERKHVELTEKLEESLDESILPRATIGIASEDVDVGALIDAAVDKLPPRCREVWVMFREQRRPHAEIAADLGITVTTAWKHLGNAKQAIRKELTRAGFRLSDDTIKGLPPHKLLENSHE